MELQWSTASRPAPAAARCTPKTMSIAEGKAWRTPPDRSTIVSATTKLNAQSNPNQRVAKPNINAMPQANWAQTDKGARTCGEGKPCAFRNATNSAMREVSTMLSQTPQIKNEPTSTRQQKIVMSGGDRPLTFDSANMIPLSMALTKPDKLSCLVGQRDKVKRVCKTGAEIIFRRSTTLEVDREVFSTQ